MAIKSLVVQVGVDIACKAHNCQANAKHRIERGHVRLKVRNGRGWDHYCRACAMTIIARDISKLTVLQSLTPDNPVTLTGVGKSVCKEWAAS
jgi:hypothetical protein